MTVFLFQCRSEIFTETAIWVLTYLFTGQITLSECTTSDKLHTTGCLISKATKSEAFSLEITVMERTTLARIEEVKIIEKMRGQRKVCVVYFQVPREAVYGIR